MHINGDTFVLFRGCNWFWIISNSV